MNLLDWFICWVADNHNTFSPHEQEELDTLIKRIKIELQDCSDSKDHSLIRSEEHQQRNSELSPSHVEETSCLSVDETERDVPNFEVRDIFLSLVKIYLKDAKQINLSHQSSTTESSSILEEDPQLDNDSDTTDDLECSNQDTDLQSDSSSSSIEEKTFDGADSSTEISSVRTNCSTSDLSSEEESTTSSKTRESSRKLRHIRQDLKKVSNNLLKVDANTDSDTIANLHEVLSSNRLKLDAVDCVGNNCLNTAREVLIEHTGRLVARLETRLNFAPPNSEMPNSSPVDRIERWLQLAERLNEDMKLSIFDSRADMDLKIFDEKLTCYLIQLDGVPCGGDKSLLAARKKAVKYIQRLILCLEIKLLFDTFLTNNIEDSCSSATKDRTRKRIGEVESAIKTVECLSNTFGEFSDDYFSVSKLFRRCFVQLKYIECQDDEQLLNQRKKVVEYFDELLAYLENTWDSEATEPCDEPAPRCSATTAKSFESIKKVEEEGERLNVHIEFGSFQSRTDRIYVYVEETLTKLLIDLDSVNCEGDEEVRAARKKAVQYINKLTENLEARIPS